MTLELASGNRKALNDQFLLGIVEKGTVIGRTELTVGEFLQQRELASAL
jgi:hypothetical protein